MQTHTFYVIRDWQVVLTREVPGTSVGNALAELYEELEERQFEYQHVYPTAVWEAVSAYREAALALKPGRKWVRVVNTYDDDDPINGFTMGRECRMTMAEDEIIEEALQEVARYSDFCNPPKEWKEVLSLASERGSEWANIGYITVADDRKRREERERKECQALAAFICSQYKVKVDSVEFISAVRRHYKRIMGRERHYREDGESRMERYAGYDDKENFFRDNDYSSSLEGDARRDMNRLLSYIKRHLPLTYLAYKEGVRRRKQKG